MGALQLAKGDREAAEDAFRRAVDGCARVGSRRTPGLPTSSGPPVNSRKPRREFKAALAIEPTSPAVNRAMAAFYISQNRATEAEPYLKSYAEESGTTEARLLLADYYVRGKRVPEATSILSSLGGGAGGFVQATLRLAVLDFIGGRRPEAYKKLDAILQREPRNESALEAQKLGSCWPSGRTRRH